MSRPPPGTFLMAGRIRSGRLALLILAGGAFVVGTAELLVVGVLNRVAAGMHVTVSTAGLLVTAYALGISIGGPVVNAVTIRLGRKPVLLAALATYVVGNLGAVVATGFRELAAARAVTGTVHGLFIGVAMSVGVTLVPAEQRGKAISVVFGGISVATVLGVPLGTLIGQTLGWRAAFVGIVALGCAALLLTALFVPGVGALGAGDLRVQVSHALSPRVLAMLGLGLLVMGGQFTAFTYLTPFLQRVTHVGSSGVSVFLLVYGVSCALGTIVGGRLADRGAPLILQVGSALVVLALTEIYVASSHPVAVGAGVALWGAAGFGLVPALQLRIIGLAGAGGDLASTLGASAVNAGIAIGALVGGIAVGQVGIRDVFAIAVPVTVLAVAAAIATRRLGATRGEAENGEDRPMPAARATRKAPTEDPNLV